MVGPAAQRAGAAHLKAAMGLSERRACSIIGADRTMVRYRSRRPPDTELRARLRELANERRRFGYRRLFILLRREGELSGINRVHRLYREEGLAWISQTPKRIGAPNQRKFFCEKDFAMIRGAPRCRQSVAQNSSILESWKAALWKQRLMPDW
jgi:transposase InsO family protein